MLLIDTCATIYWIQGAETVFLNRANDLIYIYAYCTRLGCSSNSLTTIVVADPGFKALEHLFASWRQQRDIGQLSPYAQTCRVDAFNALILNSAPKNIHFDFHGMLAR